MVILRLAAQMFNPLPVAPERCPTCGSRGLSRWGVRRRPVKDRGCQAATVQRYRCKGCGHTCTAHPEGLGRSPQSRPYQATVLALYLLGLSLRRTSQVLALFHAPPVAFVTVWRDVQRWGQQFRRRRTRGRVVGVDTTFVRMRGKPQGVLVAVELNGRTVLVQAVGSPQDYRRAFATLRRWGVEVVISDDDHAFIEPMEEGAFHRQGCLWHAHRVVGRALGQLSAADRDRWRPVVDLLRASLRDLPPDPPASLFQAQTLPLPPPLRYAVLYLLNLWRRLTLYQRLPGLPRTNNLSERAIGRSKFRARTVRGFKSVSGVLNFFATTQALLAAA